MRFLMMMVAAVCWAQQPKPEIENQYVRVMRLKLESGGTVGSSLSDRVVVFLTGDGSHKAGDVAWFPAGTAQTVNRSVEEVVVELKNTRVPPSHVTLDPVNLDPKHHPVPLENDRVRVLHTILEPGIKSPMHEHPPYVVVYLTVLHTTMKLADGREVDNPRKPGEIAWRDFLKHETLNIGDKTAEEIQIELK